MEIEQMNKSAVRTYLDNQKSIRDSLTDEQRLDLDISNYHNRIRSCKNRYEENYEDARKLDADTHWIASKPLQQMSRLRETISHLEEKGYSEENAELIDLISNRLYDLEEMIIQFKEFLEDLPRRVGYDLFNKDNYTYRKLGV